jgi:hypothetical protein
MHKQNIANNFDSVRAVVAIKMKLQTAATPMLTAGLRLLEQWHQAKPPVKAPSNILEPSYNVSINGSCIGMQFKPEP